MLKILTKNDFLMQIPKGKRVAIAILLTHREPMCGRVSCPIASSNYSKHSDIEYVREIIDYLTKFNEFSCIISFCSNIRLNYGNIIGLCNGGHAVAKHRYDEALKCLTFSDMLLVISNSSIIPKIFANLLCMAQIENVEISILKLKDF